MEAAPEKCLNSSHGANLRRVATRQSRIVMTDAHADRYVSDALAFHEGWDAFEVVASASTLPVVADAFGRRGWTATAQARAGLLLVERSSAPLWVDGDGPKVL